MVMLCVLTAVASALLDNVTTILLIAPVTFLVCQRLGLRPVPFLMAEVFASNIGGAATLVGDPPNIIIAARGDLSFNDFLVNMAPIVVVLMVVFCLLCRWLFRRDFSYDPERAASVMRLNEREAITDKPLLVKSLAVLTLVDARVRPAPGAALRAVRRRAARRRAAPPDHRRRRSPDALREVEWPTLAFFAGLFIMVGGLVETGVIGEVAEVAGRRDRGPARAGDAWSCSAGPPCCPPSSTTSRTSRR